jgi:hypothetical protein
MKGRGKTQEPFPPNLLSIYIHSILAFGEIVPSLAFFMTERHFERSNNIEKIGRKHKTHTLGNVERPNFVLI